MTTIVQVQTLALNQKNFLDTHAGNLLEESNELEVTEEQNQHLYDPNDGDISEVLDDNNLDDYNGDSELREIDEEIDDVV